MPEQEIIICNNCSTKLSGEYCTDCGRPRKLKRIDRQYILTEVGSVINFDKGIFYTVRELLLRPGLSIQKFIEKDRNRLVKPIVFVIVCSLVFTFIQKWF